MIFNIYSSVWQHHGSFTDRLVSVQSYHTIFAIPVCLLWNYRWRGKSQDLPRTFCPRSTTQTSTVTEFTETKAGNQLYSHYKKTYKASYSQSRFQNKLKNLLFFFLISKHFWKIKFSKKQTRIFKDKFFKTKFFYKILKKD